jgi:hypothetical protein
MHGDNGMIDTFVTDDIDIADAGFGLIFGADAGQ